MKYTLKPVALMLPFSAVEVDGQSLPVVELEITPTKRYIFFVEVDDQPDPMDKLEKVRNILKKLIPEKAFIVAASPKGKPVLQVMEIEAAP